VNHSNRILELLAQNDVFLAPMAGVTDRSFRILCKEMGCGLTYTEMVSAKGLHYGGSERRTEALLSIDPLEAPAAIQLFGSDPAILAEQAAALADRMGGDLALIDINMGCPAKKIVANGEGSALMRDMDKAYAVISAVARSVDLPVTVKFRKGWDDTSVNAVEFAVMAQQAGADAVTVHGRTREQQYAGKADWDIIRQVKQAVSIPVIGNGDVFSADDYFHMKQQTGCDGVMIARGAMGNPWIFAAVRAAKQGIAFAPPSAKERVEMALRHAKSLVDQKGARAIVEMRKHAAWYIKGIPGAAAARNGINDCESYEELEKLLFDLVQQSAK
jgi:tRNA-dihydrouridine synthase B